MKELPILFNGAMVRSVLAGIKTQTRRIVKTDLSNLEWLEDEPDHLFVEDEYGDWNNLIEECPVKKGDLLYVREKFCPGEIEILTNGSAQIKKSDKIIFAADMPEDELKTLEDCDLIIKWKPSIFHKKVDCRIWLKVVSVKVEKLNTISEKDAKAEGPPILPSYDYKNCFRVLWDSINKDRGYGWDKNPYVWVYEFERIER